jgi:sec-independent protein translocase protein TatA
MGMLGGTELLIIAFVIILLFGGKKLPELARGLGKGIKNFKKSLEDDDSSDVTNSIDKNMKKDDEESK